MAFDGLGKHSPYAAAFMRTARTPNLPVEQASKFLFAVNMKTAKALGLEIPNQLRLTADEVID